MFDALMRARPGECGAGPEELVEALLRRPGWHQQAACRGAGAAMFFVERGQSTDEAKAICSTCPAATECLAAGVAGDELGVWAGTSSRERRRLADREGETLVRKASTRMSPPLSAQGPIVQQPGSHPSRPGSNHGNDAPTFLRPASSG